MIALHITRHAYVGLRSFNKCEEIRGLSLATKVEGRLRERELLVRREEELLKDIVTNIFRCFNITTNY